MSKTEEKFPCSDTQHDEDRISALPNEVLHHILSLMPLKMAMRTSILSTRWRHLWQYTRVVDLGELPFSEEYPVDYTPISRCLKRLKSSKIHAFYVNGLVGSCSYPNVKRWVDLALSKHVSVLKIDLSGSGTGGVDYFELPSSLFSENHTHGLTVLSLSLIEFPLPCYDVNFWGFASLKDLSLRGCKLDDRTVELVVANCCLLENLVIDNCEGLNNVKISRSNLRLDKLAFRWIPYPDGMMLEVDVPSLLELEYSGSLARIDMKNSSRLRRAVIKANGHSVNEASIDHVRKWIHQVAQVRSLQVNSWLLQFLAKEHSSRGSEFLKFQNLEFLCFQGRPRSQHDVVNFVTFLRDCPSLEYCVIDFLEVISGRFISLAVDNPNFVKGREDELHDCASLEKLKLVVVRSFSGSEGEMMLVKLLLQKAVNLLQLKILWRENPGFMSGKVDLDMGGNLIPASQRALIEETVSHLPRASPVAQLKFCHGG